MTRDRLSSNTVLSLAHDVAQDIVFQRSCFRTASTFPHIYSLGTTTTLLEEFKYDAFVSYRRSDGTATARWLRQRLLQYRAPKPLSTDYGVKLRVYLDTIYERATYDFFKKNIKPSLAQSKHLIVICTPDALKARADGTPNWVTREVEYFMSLPQGSNIIPVLARTAEALPHAIRDAYANIEVIDLRLYSHTSWLFPGRTQYLNDELLKIIAALMVVPDEQMPTLRREESRRRQRGCAYSQRLAWDFLVW